jgi:hypothetical protein
VLSLIFDPDAAPEKGENFAQIADDYQSLIVPGLTHWQHPSFFAYFPTAGTFEGILGELYATSTPNPGFNVRAARFPLPRYSPSRSGRRARHAPSWRRS